MIHAAPFGVYFMFKFWTPINADLIERKMSYQVSPNI